jgi:hypothetical protein
LLLAGATLLPVLAWLSTALGHPLLPPQAWAWLLAVAVYLWICSLAAARRPNPPARPAPSLPAAEAVPVAAARLDDGMPAQAPVSANSASLESAPAAIPAAPAQAGENAAAADPPSASPSEAAGGLRPPAGLPPVEKPSAGLPPAPSPPTPPAAEAEAGPQIDEIARRVAVAGGIFGSCVHTAEQAAADVQAMLDEERHAQKVLTTLRSRLMLLDQSCHALAQAALGAQPAAPQREAVAPLVEAAMRQVLLCHQLAERLGAAERAHGPRMQALRRGVDQVAMNGERGLLECQQTLALARRMATGSAQPDTA